MPIDSSYSEVELRTYVNSDPSRLASITRKRRGVTEFTYSGFTYDIEKRVTQATTLDSAQPFAFAFDDGIPTTTTAPGAPADGTWKTETAADEFGRPKHMWRWITGGSKQAYTFQYQTSFSPRPTRLVRGLDAAPTSITDFVYDDFGQLVESVVPEQGVTRYEYDIAGNLWKERVGVGTALVRTSQRSYDSLGRLLLVDHDTEHPVNCSSAPAGTKIQDEEYRYDSCAGDEPAGFGGCTNALGRLAFARSVLHCTTGNVAVRRGRWFKYDTAGRLASINYVTKTGTTFGAPATSAFSYSAGSRVTGVGSPLNSIYSTTYLLGVHGRAARSMKTVHDTVTLAQNIDYRSFGPLKSLDTGVTISGNVLKLALTHRTDDSLGNLNWRYGFTSYLNQNFTYTPAGLIQTREEIATLNNGIEHSRYYKYDPLLRMTCEARGSGSTHPTSADCVPSSPRLRGLFTFHDGASATQPPDVRATAHLKANLYPDSLTETSTYSGGSGKVIQISRGGSNNLVLGYDDLGRRTFDYDSYDAVRSRRDYTYLPNGQLASISGQLPDGVTPYSVAVNYDTDGRPLTITDSQAGTTHELFWDEASRLLSAQITAPQTPCLGITTKTIQWHYHYLGSTPVAATRIINTGPYPCPVTSQRFWFLTDERGLIHRALTSTGVEHFRAKWDASGWRTVEVQTGGAIDMWVPFALPGQLILDKTSAFAAASGYPTHTRPPLSLNQWRVYDPLTGTFLSPDSTDRTGRLSPEGYGAFRSSPTTFSDSRGTDSNGWNSPFSMGDSCTQNSNVLTAGISLAFFKVAKCSTECGVLSLTHRE